MSPSDRQRRGELEGSSPRPGASLRAPILVGLVALAARVAVAFAAAGRFPPAADGAFYHRIAERIAAGLGSTWAWPDGVVTYAAHYPVGYPAALGALYAVFGPEPLAAMLFNAAAGAVGAVAVERLAARIAPGKGAIAAGLLVALHPGLVAYTPALMTEGVTASLLACGAWAAAWAREARAAGDANDARAPEARGEGRRSFAARVAVVGIVLGMATLVRPQSLVLAPVFGALAAGAAGAARSLRRATVAGAIATAAAFFVCAPWTVRNCVRMDRCALVSVNAGWNLLIGADPAATGAWSPIRVPEACREVWGEADKDACFEREALRLIAARPLAWLALAPRKLAATFDYCGAAGWYLHEASPAAFPEEHKIALGAVETVYERLTLAAALVFAGRAAMAGRRRGAAAAAALVALAGIAFALSRHAWPGYLALVVLLAASARAWLAGPVLPVAAASVLAATMLTHVAFFGAGRYALVTMPLVCGLAALALRRARSGTAGAGRDILGPSRGRPAPSAGREVKPKCR